MAQWDHDGVGQLCAAWREAAGKPGDAVMREVEAMMGCVEDESTPAEDAGGDAGRGGMTRSDDDIGGRRLLLTHKNENLYNAYALEVAAVAPGSRGLAVGLFAAPRAISTPVLARMTGLRAVIDPLCVGATADALVAAAKALPVHFRSILDGNPPPPVALHHDCVARHPNRVPSPDLYRTLGEVVGTWGGGFKHGMFARFSGPDEARAAAEAETLRFAVVETARGYILGLTNFAPHPPPPACDWNRKPNNYSAGTRMEIAAAALNAVVGAGVKTNDAPERGLPAGTKEEKNENARAVVLDPCCGSGTILYAAWLRGYDAFGGDINPSNVANARGNLGSFRPAMPRAHASFAVHEAGGSHNSRRNENDGWLWGSAVDAEGLLASPPTIVEADALEVSDWSARASAALGGTSASERGGARAEVAAIVSNLPFGRRVAVGGKRGEGRSGGADAEDYAPLLAALLPQAARHAFVSGVPIGDTMRGLGYVNVTEVPICRFGRIFLTVALGEGAIPLTPRLSYTMEDAIAAKGRSERVHAEKPEWMNARGGDDAGAATRPSTPPLRVAIDTSYDQDSQRAIRSVAKQLAECIGVMRKEAEKVNVELTFAAWRGTVADHALEHFNAERWVTVARDPRDVEEIFMNASDVGPSDEGSLPPPEAMVYLSPDAEEVLEDVDADTVYVIGGIVDLKARGVAWSLPRAKEAGIRARRFPIREHMPGVTNQILNIDTAFKLLCERYQGKEWADALEAALPTRQQGERPARLKRPMQSASAPPR